MKNQKIDEKKKRNHEKCLECPHIPCINLYRKAGELEGGELYVLEEVIQRRLHVPCETGFLLQLILNLTNILSDVNLPSYFLFLQCLNDLKASIYLLLSAHYRNAIQLLRPVIENYLVGLYFDAKYLLAEDEKERTQLEKSFFVDFWNEKYQIPKEEWKDVFPNEKRRKRKLDYSYCLKWLIAKRVINSRIGSKIEKMIHELNNYLHPAFKHTDIGKSDSQHCPTTVKYDEEEYRKVVTFFQDISLLIIKVLCSYIYEFLPNKRQNE